MLNKKEVKEMMTNLMLNENVNNFTVLRRGFKITLKNHLVLVIDFEKSDKLNNYIRVKVFQEGFYSIFNNEIIENKLYTFSPSKVLNVFNKIVETYAIKDNKNWSTIF